MTPDELRAAIADARTVDLDPEARPYVILSAFRTRIPGMRCRVLPGVTGEVVGETRVLGGYRIACRVFCDDLERYLGRTE